MSETKSKRPDLEMFKLSCRLLEMRRRELLAAEWKRNPCGLLRGQFFNLMLIRFILPCNLGKIMELTGLTSAGASLFVDKLVQRGFLNRTDNPEDRRNVRIDVTSKGQEFLSGVESRINEYITSYFDTCSEEEIREIARGTDIICRKIR